MHSKNFCSHHLSQRFCVTPRRVDFDDFAAHFFIVVDIRLPYWVTMMVLFNLLHVVVLMMALQKLPLVMNHVKGYIYIYICTHIYIHTYIYIYIV